MITRSAIRVGLLFLGILGTTSARGQMGTRGGGRPLGGYGASTIGSYYGGGGTAYVPYNGRSGLVPSGGGPSAPPVPRRPVSTPIGGASSGSSRVGIGMGERSGRRRLATGEGMGMGFGGTVGTPMTGRGPMRRGSTGPGLAWPFSVPAGLTGAGPMTMP